MSTKILSPVGPITATNLLYTAAGGSLIGTYGGGGDSFSIPVAAGQFVGKIDSPPQAFAKTNMGYLLGYVSHTMTTAGGYGIAVPDADTHPFLSYVCIFNKVTSSAVVQPYLRCATPGEIYDGGSNYRRRAVVNTGSAFSVTNANQTQIILGYAYSALAGGFTNSCYTTGEAYVKTGAHRIFMHKERYATSASYSAVMLESTSWVNTADPLTHIAVYAPAATYLQFWLYQRRY